MARVPFAAPVLAALVACSLAGCSGDVAEPGADGLDLRGPPETEATLPRPEWAVGDAWTYDFEGVSTAYVVTSETATDWIVETDSEERAFSDLRQDISRLGPQRKSDLAGSQGDDRIEFFRWPLEAGATWRTRWDAQDVSVQVVAVEDGVASLQANEAGGNGSLVYRYTFDAEARWFGELRRYEPDGTEAVRLTLAKADRAWSGTIVRWTLQEIVADESPPTTQPPIVAGPFEVAEGTTDIWADYHFTCTGNGGFTVAIVPLNPGLAGQQAMEDGGPCTQVDWSGPTIAGPHPGRWAFALSAGGETVAYDYTLLLRTRVDVPFPA